MKSKKKGAKKKKRGKKGRKKRRNKDKNILQPYILKSLFQF